MNIDAKQKVLLAIYTEYQKDMPDMSRITHTGLDMDAQVFRVAIDKLESEGYIRGAKVHYPAGRPYPDAVIPNFIKMTREGLQFVEEKMDIERGLTGSEKVAELRTKFGKFGWNALTDFAAKTLVELAKQVI